MPKIYKKSDICDYLISCYPLENQEFWDHAGYSFKNNLKAKLTGIILAVDITKEVIEKALETKSNLIITHHPFLFEKNRKIEYMVAPYKKELIQIINKHKITCLSLHTNYDIDSKGTSYQLIKKLGLEDKIYENGVPFGVSFNNNLDTDEIIKLIKKHWKVLNLRKNFVGNITPKKISVHSGSGDIYEIMKLANEGVELFISGDFKWNQWVTFNQSNIKIIEVPHLTEEIMAEHLSEKILAKFNDISIYYVEQKEIYFNN